MTVFTMENENGPTVIYRKNDMIIMARKSIHRGSNPNYTYNECGGYSIGLQDTYIALLYTYEY